MKEKIAELMQKIGLLEKDLDLQKHILKATPTGKEEEAREVLHTIATIKAKIEVAKQDIKRIDPEEFDRMVRFEGAAERFKEAAEGREFVSVVDLNTAMECKLEKTDGSIIECLVKAKDVSGEWLIMTVDGDVMTLDAESVVG